MKQKEIELIKQKSKTKIHQNDIERNEKILNEKYVEIEKYKKEMLSIECLMDQNHDDTVKILRNYGLTLSSINQNLCDSKIENLFINSKQNAQSVQDQIEQIILKAMQSMEIPNNIITQKMYDSRLNIDYDKNININYSNQEAMDIDNKQNENEEQEKEKEFVETEKELNNKKEEKGKNEDDKLKKKEEIKMEIDSLNEEIIKLEQEYNDLEKEWEDLGIQHKQQMTEWKAMELEYNKVKQDKLSTKELIENEWNQVRSFMQQIEGQFIGSIKELKKLLIKNKNESKYADDQIMPHQKFGKPVKTLKKEINEYMSQFEQYKNALNAISFQNLLKEVRRTQHGNNQIPKDSLPPK